MPRPPCRDEQAQPLASPIHGPSGDPGLPPIQAISSSKCPVPIGFGHSRRRVRVSLGPNFRTQRQTVSSEVSTLRLAESSSPSRGGAEVDRNAMPDDPSWRLMTNIGNRRHPYPVVSRPNLSAVS